MNELLPTVRTLPLKEMDGVLLSVTIREEAARLGMNVDKVAEAIALASYLHRNQVRKHRGEMPVTHYIEHPLRGALRFLRYGGWAESILVSIILHDVIEDGLDDLLALGNHGESFREKDLLYRRHRAYALLEEWFNIYVANTVWDVSNPVPDGKKHSQAEKRKIYVDHVTEAITSPEVAVVKFVDFIDNGASLHHHAGLHPEMVAHLSQKYLPLVNVFRARIAKQDIQELVSDEGYDLMLTQLSDAGLRLSQLSILR